MTTAPTIDYADLKSVTGQQMIDRMNELNKALGYPGTYRLKRQSKGLLLLNIQMMEKELAAR